MANDQKWFLVKLNWNEWLLELSDEDAGKFIKALYNSPFKALEAKRRLDLKLFIETITKSPLKAYLDLKPFNTLIQIADLAPELSTTVSIVPF